MRHPTIDVRHSGPAKLATTSRSDSKGAGSGLGTMKVKETIGRPAPAIPSERLPTRGATEVVDAPADDGLGGTTPSSRPDPLWVFAIGLGIVFVAMAAVLTSGYQ